MAINNDLINLIEQLLEFPESKICKHSVCLDILEVLEHNRVPIDQHLVFALVNADTETALDRVKKR